MIERCHAKLKKTLKINGNVDKPQRGQYFDIAIMPHNTTYHTSIKCSTTEFFHGRIPYTALDIKYWNPSKQMDTNYTEVNQIFDKMHATFRQNSNNIINAYDKDKAHYDRNPRAQPPKLNNLCSF